MKTFGYNGGQNGIQIRGSNLTNRKNKQTDGLIAIGKNIWATRLAYDEFAFTNVKYTHDWGVIQ